MRKDVNTYHTDKALYAALVSLPGVSRSAPLPSLFIWRQGLGDSRRLPLLLGDGDTAPPDHFRGSAVRSHPFLGHTSFLTMPPFCPWLLGALSYT